MGKKQYKKWQIFNFCFLCSWIFIFKSKSGCASCTLKSKKKMLLIRSTNLIRNQKLVTFLISFAQFCTIYCNLLPRGSTYPFRDVECLSRVCRIHDAKCHNAIFPPHFEILQMPKFFSVVTKKFAGWNMNLEFASIFLTSREVSPPLIFFRLKEMFAGFSIPYCAKKWLSALFSFSSFSFIRGEKYA